MYSYSSSIILLLPILFLLISSLSANQVGPNLKLLQCFEFKKNYWIVGHAFHTSSVQFKDECLRMCLTSSIRKAKCLSAMHVPNDDECVISDQDQTTKPDLFVENDSPNSFTVNFFRNICIDPPGGEDSERFEARLQGYRGGEGIIELAQAGTKNTQAMVVISGLKENSNFEVRYVPELGGTTNCQKARDVKGKLLMSIETDHTGMAIQPWIDIDFNLFDDDNVVDKVIVVIDKTSKIVVDCGTVKIAHSNETVQLRKLSASLYGPLSILTMFIMFL